MTQLLAGVVANVRDEDVPPAARHQVARLLTDHVGIAVMGCQLTGAAYARLAAERGGRPEASLLGAGRRVPVELAAGVNAQMCRNTDYEETGPGLHAGPVVAMTALAVGERVGASGASVVTAMAVGYELNAKFFLAHARGDIRHLGLTAAAVAGRLLDLDPIALNRAMSLAWELPSPSLDFSAPKTPKRISRLGMANLVSARHGIEAALLVQHGLDTPTDELDLQPGDHDLAALRTPLAPFEHTATSLMLKPWPASRFSNGCLQLAEQLTQEEVLDPRDIDRVVLHLPDVYLLPHQSDPAPDDYWQAIYSVQWATAMVLLGVPPGPAWFAPDRLADPVARELAGRVHLVESPQASSCFASRRWLDIPTALEVHTSSRVHRAEIVHRDVLGTPQTPMPLQRFEAKFLRLTEPYLGRATAAALFAGLSAIEDCQDVGALTADLVQTG